MSQRSVHFVWRGGFNMLVLELHPYTSIRKTFCYGHFRLLVVGFSHLRFLSSVSACRFEIRKPLLVQRHAKRSSPHQRCVPREQGLSGAYTHLPFRPLVIRFCLQGTGAVGRFGRSRLAGVGYLHALLPACRASGRVCPACLCRGAVAKPCKKYSPVFFKYNVSDKYPLSDEYPFCQFPSILAVAVSYSLLAIVLCIRTSFSRIRESSGHDVFKARKRLLLYSYTVIIEPS